MSNADKLHKFNKNEKVDKFNKFNKIHEKQNKFVETDKNHEKDIEVKNNIKKEKIRDKILIDDNTEKPVSFVKERIEKLIECQLMNDSNKLNEENSIIENKNVEDSIEHIKDGA